MYADYHVHTNHSPDCQIPMEAQILRALELGITDLCFTDHIELGLEEWGDLVIDLEAYRKEYHLLRRKYPQLHLRFGVEAGISCPPSYFEQLKQMMAAMEYDFVIASAHTLNGKNVLKDFDYNGDGLSRICRDYIPSILRRLKTLEPETYSCVGHIDFPLKGALRCQADCRQYRYDFASEEMDALFRFIIDSGKCLELNVSPWGFMPPEERDKADWLRHYARLGGEFITIGSDSHKTENTGMFFRDAVELARSAGIRYLAVYENMQPRMIPLSQL